MEWAVGSGFDVAFEGILASITYERYADLAGKMQDAQVRYQFIFLMPDRAKCFEHINARRKTSKVVRGPFKEELFDAKVKMLDRCCARYERAGFEVIKADSAVVAANQIIHVLDTLRAGVATI